MGIHKSDESKEKPTLDIFLADLTAVQLRQMLLGVATIILGIFPGAWFAITREAALLGAKLVARG